MSMRNIEREGIESPVISDERGDNMDGATLRAILSSSLDPIVVQDAEGRLVHASDAFASMMGVRTSSDLIGKTWAEIDPRGEMSSVEDLRKGVLRSGEGAPSEIVHRGERCFSLTVTPLSCGNERCTATVTMMRDITGQKELEALRKDLAILRRVVESVRDLIYLKDSDGRYVLANASLIKSMGRRAEEVLGRGDLELLDDWESALAIIENDLKVMRSGTEEMFEERVRLPNGVHTFMTDKTPSRDKEGHITGVIGISRDVTENKRSERIERARSRWLESILESAPVAIGVSRDGHTLYANPRYLKMFGYSNLEEIKGRPFAEQLAPEDRDRAMTMAMEYSRGRPLEPEIELTGLRRDGSRFPFRAAITIAELPDGPALLGFFTDLTERKRLEEGLEESRHVNELYIDILTHDISNYNAAAMGYLQLADMNLELDDKVRGLISRSLQALADSSELIANIRDLQNIEAGRDRPEVVDICVMLDEIKEVYKNPPDREVSISLTTHDVCTVYGSRLLRGAFSNLISNAIKHSTGAVDIQITVSRQHLHGTDMVRVDIADNGPGIPYEKRGFIFDRSLMGLTKPVSRGLGLYLVKRLVESYDGEIWVEDRIPGAYMEGARFVVLLPEAK
jgi:PAS domain S-box-containing protein